MTRVLLGCISRANVKLSALSARIVKWTGRSKEYTHPKHLLLESEAGRWYFNYLSQGGAVLDLGCDAGAHSIRVSQKCSVVVGVDSNRTRLQAARSSARETSTGRVHWVNANLEYSLPFKNGSFKSVLFLDTLEHLNARNAALTEVDRVLAGEGILILAVPKIDTTWKKRLSAKGICPYADPDHKIEYTVESLRRELEEAGFSITQDLGPIVLDTPWSGILDLVGSVFLPLYETLLRWKRQQALEHPEESTGFRVVCVKSSRP